jgi:hypothetical protein
MGFRGVGVVSMALNQSTIVRRIILHSLCSMYNIAFEADCEELSIYYHRHQKF